MQRCTRLRRLQTSRGEATGRGVIYDAKGSRLIFFGGWASRWFGDLHTLDVGSVVDPPYAIMGIEPRIGPITGNQQIDIEGIDFVPTDQVTIRFVSKKGAVDIGGEYISATST